MRHCFATRAFNESGFGERHTQNAEARMSSFPGSPKLVKGGLVVLDAASGAVRRTIVSNGVRVDLIFQSANRKSELTPAKV